MKNPEQKRTRSFCLKVISALAVIVLLAGWGALPSKSYAQSRGWSQPVPISPQGGFAWFPDVAIDLTGQIHVVWAGGSSRYDAVMYTTSRDGQAWSQINDIAAFAQVAGSEASRPGIYIDQHNLLNMTFRSTTVYYSQAPTASAFSAGAWLSPKPISSGQVAYFSRVARDGEGTLHLIFSENVITSSCPICYHIFYRRSDDNGINWTPPVDISRLATGSAKLLLLIDEQDNLHVAWEAGRGGSYGQLEDPTRVMYAASFDRGTTWTSPSEMNPPEVRAKAITIGLGREGQLVAAWLSLPEDKVYYQISSNQGRSWSVPQPIPGVWGGWSLYPARLDDYAMATDSAGDVHLICVGRTAENQSSLSVLHLAWNGTNWSQPEAILTFEGDVPEWPRIAVGNGNQLHVVWYVRDQKHIWGDSPDGSAPQFQIWYAQALTTAPEVTATAMPLAIPTPDSQIASQATPETSLIPTSVPELTHDTTPSYSERDGLLLLIQSLIPAVLLIGTIIIGVHLRRR